MRVLVTGATGFVGRQLVLALPTPTPRLSRLVPVGPTPFDEVVRRAITERSAEGVA